jgi:hypothetical protein
MKGNLMIHRLSTPAIAIMVFATTLSGANADKPNSSAAVLVRGGSLRATVIVSEALYADFPDMHARYTEGFANTAVAELREHLALVADGKLAVTRVAAKETSALASKLKRQGQTPIILGGPELDLALRQAITRNGDEPESFALRVRSGSVTIVGLSPKGTLNGVYEALEQLGFRWYMPGELGRVVPRGNSDLALNEQLTVQVPSFPARWLHGTAMKSPLWQRRTRMGGFSVPPSHGGVPRDVTDRKAIQSHADRIVANIRGKKLKEPYIVGLGPPDRPGWFNDTKESLALDADDYDPFFGGMSHTDRLMWFYNQVLKRVDEQVPDANVRIVFYAYHDYVRPPVRKDDVDPRIIPAFAPITLCRVHGMGETICPEKHYYRQVVKGWHEAVPEVYVRGYYFNLAGPGVMFSMTHRLRKEIPIMHKLGVSGFRQEVIPKWGSETPSLYIASRLMWNHTADVDALLADFYRKFFGPAAEPMGNYLDLMDAALRDTDHHTGCAHDVIHWYPVELRAKAKSLLGESAARATNGIYAKRVRAFRGTFDFTESLALMLQHRAAHRYAAAKKELDRMRGLIDRLSAYDPPMLHPRYSRSYLDRFFAPATEQAFKRVTGGNKLMAGLDDEWKFLVDHEDVGEVLGYWRPQMNGGSWQRARTSTTSWSNLGLRYYMKKPAWYRQSVNLPESAAGKTIYLWFGGVDDFARVWVNGKEVGAAKGAFKPFEFDVTEAVRPGERNVVVVKVVDRSLSELGTGGITAPAMFYAREACR